MGETRIALRYVAILFSVAVAAGAQAQSDVSQSTDPAKAAAVERAVQELKARRAREPTPTYVRSPDGLVRGTSASGVAYVSGGVTIDERKALYAMRAQYNLWVATVAKPSGAYLSDARLRITDLSDQRVVIEQTMYGPWFFSMLPPGRYEVSGTVFTEGTDTLQTIAAEVRIVGGTTRQAVLRFPSAAIVGAEAGAAFGGNPFGASAPKR